MTRANLSPSTAVPTQRNRRLLLTLPAAVALPSLITACGGGADLSYETEQALYVVGEAIPPNKPQPALPNPPPPGHTAPKFTVFPPLPAGLTLNAQTGVISGTPTKQKRLGTHLVVAANNKGIVQTQIRIAVTGRGAWVPAATIPGVRVSSGIAPLPGRKVLVAGGYGGAGVGTSTATSVQIYDAPTGTWSSAASLPTLRSNPVTVALNDGRVVVVGGSVGSQLGATEIYDPVTNTWTSTGRMNEPRIGCTAHLLPSGKVLVVGGFNNSIDVRLDTAELLDPISGDWTPLSGRLTVPREFHASVLLQDGQTLLVVGGTRVGTAELYKVDGTGTTEIPYGVVGQYHQAVKLDDGSVLITSDGSDLARRFNPANSSWTTSTMVSGSRFAPTSTLLADGRVLVAGGQNTNTAEIYNPDFNRWTAAAPMAAARCETVAALLSDGSVLVVSGRTSAGFVNASERYIP